MLNLMSNPSSLSLDSHVICSLDLASLVVVQLGSRATDGNVEFVPMSKWQNKLFVG